MARLSFASLRVRLLLLVLLAVVPALGLTLYTNLEERELRKAHVQEHARRLSRLVAADQERLIEDARQLLLILARLPAVQRGERVECNALLADLLKQYSLYANFGVANTAGDVFCSALSMPGPVNVADRAWFERAVRTHDFAIGEYQIGRLTGKATVNFGYPVLDDAERVRSVVFSALDLAWLNEVAAQAGLPQGSLLVVIDRNGTILARHPDPAKWVGRTMPESAVVKAILGREGDGTAEAPGADGIPRLFSFAPLRGAGQRVEAYVSIGVPTAVAFAGANRTLVRNLVTLGFVAVLALAAAWVGANLFIVRRVEALVAATERLSAGDLSVRTGLPHGRGELGQLAGAFDQMAESLQAANEQRLLEEELRRKNYELEQQNRAIEETNRLKTEFVSMVSHELRTPLTSIQGYVEVLLEGAGGPLTGEQREALVTVGNNAERLLGLINDLLDLSRIEAGRIELRRAPLDLARLIQQVGTSLLPLINAKRQRLVFDVSDALPPVWADGDRVTQILTNLISNAQKYTPGGGRITVAARGHNGFVQVDVSDTGIGLSQEEQAQLFTRYFRARQRAGEGPGGTGLGLVITRLLVELHGGEITVSSTPGQGSTFSFSLPVTDATPQGARDRP